MNVDLLESTIELDESFVAHSPSEIRAQVREYERGDRHDFDLTVAVPDGFLGEVMTAMCEIPYGQTRSYGDLAADLETAPVAVGRGCARNPVPLIVPCHRVVASDGSLRGYSAGDGLATKRRLLDLEATERGDRAVQTRLQTSRRSE